MLPQRRGGRRERLRQRQKILHRGHAGNPENTEKEGEILRCVTALAPRQAGAQQAAPLPWLREQPSRCISKRLVRSVVVAGEEMTAAEPPGYGAPDALDQEFFAVGPDCAAE